MKKYHRILKVNHISQKKLRQIWTQVPPDYYDRGIAKNILQRLWHTQKLKQILKLLPKKAPKVIDIGCSSGVLTAEIAKMLPESKIVGLDSYQEVIAFASKKYPKIKFMVGDAHRLPFENDSFDLVICTETLEHLTDPTRALLEIKRILKKRGQAIISMDSGSFLFKIIWWFWTKTKGRVWENAHLQEFDAQLLEDLVKKCNFTIKKKIYSHLRMAVTFLASPKK